MRVRIEGRDLPGRSCHPDDAGRGYANIHVGVQRGREPFELVAGDAPSATWSIEVTVRRGTDSATDFGGPFVHGKRGDRFLYLTWGTVSDSGQFDMFRRAKLMFADIDAGALQPALGGEGTLVGRLGLTDGKGNPRCARVRPPTIEWTWDR